MHRAGDLLIIKQKQKQNYGHACAHIGWQAFNFDANMPLAITSWTFAHHAEN